MIIVWFVLALYSILYYVKCSNYAGKNSTFLSVWKISGIIFAMLCITDILIYVKIIEMPICVIIIFRCLFITCAIIFAFIELCIISEMRKQPVNGCEYMIIPGCQIRGTRLTGSLVKRLDCALNYHKNNPDIVMIVSGGQGKGENITEALAMKQYLCKNNICENQVIVEDKSTSTVQNMKYSVNYIKDKNAKVAVVTNNFHVFRAKKLAEAQGLENVYGIAAESDNQLFVNYMVREAFGTIKDFFSGNFRKK